MERKSFWILSKYIIYGFTFLSLLFISPMPSFASPGQTALDFLNLPIGAYSASLGQANYAGIIGPEAIFLNPGHLGQRTGAFVSHQELLLDTRTEAFAVSISLKRGFAFGAAAYFLDNGKIEGYSNDNVRIGNVNSGDRLLRVGLAYAWEKLSFGISFSQYNQQLAELSANGWGIGAGASIESQWGRFGFTADNIGPDFKIGRASAPLPGRFVFSAWVPFFENRADLNIDFILRRYQQAMVAAGIEYRLIENLALRLGSEKYDHLSLGFRLSSGKIAFDYSYIPQRTFGDRHIFSFSIVK